ncbi:hypothetical protein KL929_001919 [Ogataea haglerorum]|uniref:uncharacterized protein n=1 Tax=Ogataea haglerorum TaxID=1937702 RepID=UPI001C896AB1|nr:uncharacterized protein KL911_002287 [Ogataea haglerorum]KAG7697172.1 hypothetical protein KL951_002534 [Ogataea haglerorum]KAG7732013.1 hypothetical protein KL948_002211 [Ogataea haglerorum]KAG7739776.1 hypothetical protein KL923_002623 [Ogataea haglerorum]KAG7748757.1 hypothetical protein KL912_001819 [Ogataea haglerorum]KAG7754848.1 hypothetical protein KL911_002287 [Ogataea haglerorum]
MPKQPIPGVGKFKVTGDSSKPLAVHQGCKTINVLSTPIKTTPAVRDYPTPNTSSENIERKPYKPAATFQLPEEFSRAECDALLSRYSEVIHPLVPLIDIHHFYSMYGKPWPNDNHFVLELLTILYSATIISKMPSQSLIDLMFKYLNSVPPLQKCKSLIILLFVQPKNPFGSVSTVLNISNLLELHRDPVSHHQIQDPGQVQLRRTLWWLLVQLDCFSALKNDFPPATSRNRADTKMPSENWSADGVSINPSIALLCGISHWCMCCNEVWERKYSLQPTSSGQAAKFKSEVENLAIACSATIQKLANPTCSQNDNDFIQLAIAVIASLPDRLKLIIELARDKVGLVAFYRTDHYLIQSLLIPSYSNFAWYSFFEPRQISINLFRSILNQIRYQRSRSSIVSSATFRLLQKAIQCSSHPQLKILFNELWSQFFVSQLGSLQINKLQGMKKNVTALKLRYFDQELLAITNHSGGFF